MATRKATHAGSWYTHRATELAQQLQGWLDAVEPSAGAARAVIAPHAGFSYSGPTAAYAYKHVQPATIRRVFVLGPSHHQYLRGCALTSCAWYETPLGRIAIDADTCADLRRSGLFESMALQTDEEEHSIEMHLPYVQAVMRARAYTLVPVLVGSLTPDECAQYGRVLAPHLADPACLFVVSSDFCHWGRRFNYRPIDERYAQVRLRREHAPRSDAIRVARRGAALPGAARSWRTPCVGAQRALRCSCRDTRRDTRRRSATGLRPSIGARWSSSLTRMRCGAWRWPVTRGPRRRAASGLRLTAPPISPHSRIGGLPRLPEGDAQHDLRAEPDLTAFAHTAACLLYTSPSPRD